MEGDLDGSLPYVVKEVSSWYAVPHFPRSSFMKLSLNLSRHRDIALLALRLAVAAIFLKFGLMKWGMWSGAPAEMPAMMINIMKLLSVAEPLAGVALVLGLLTQVASAGLMLVMLSAIAMKVSSGNDFTMYALDLSLLASAFVLVILGAGKYSLDAKVGKWIAREILFKGVCYAAA